MTKPRADYVRRYEPLSGVRTDFENLLQKFALTETVRYEKFSEIWREMKMSLLCSGRQDDREVREFMEECIQIAKQFFLPPSSFQTRVGALYLLYGLYMTQPCLVRVKIRVTVQEWMNILMFQSEAAQQNHLDVDYIFHYLRFQKAFHFVATSSEVYPLGRDPNDKLFTPEVFDQLSAVNDQYHEMKVELAGTDSHQPDSSLNVIQPNIVQNITRTLNNYQKIDYGTSQISEEENEFEGKGISRIKQKAFSSVAKPVLSRARRHRQVIRNYLSSPECSPRKRLKKSPKKSPKKQSLKKSIKSGSGSSQDGDMDQGQERPGATPASTSDGLLNMPTFTTAVSVLPVTDSQESTGPQIKNKPLKQKHTSSSKKATSTSSIKKRKTGKVKKDSSKTKMEIDSNISETLVATDCHKKKHDLNVETEQSGITETLDVHVIKMEKPGKKIPRMRAVLPSPVIKKRGRPKKRKEED
ncbi:hypothetical protein ScPMuIL_016105 [Solemya velum]